jgi:hypothetical protein
MLRKRSKKKKKGPLSRLTSEEMTLAGALLQEFRDVPPETFIEKVPSPQLAAALIENLPADDPSVLPLIQALQKAFSDKRVRKAAKTFAFKLKQKGLAVPEFESERQAQVPPAQNETENQLAFLGSIDPTGSRAVFVALPQKPKGFDVGIGVVSDELGLIQFHSGPYSKKRMKELESRFFEEVGKETMTSASLSHVATILENAYAVSKQESTNIPSGYLSLRPLLLEKASPDDVPAVYQYVSNEEIADTTLTESVIEKLFDHDLMASWIIDPEKLMPLLEEMEKVGESPILVSDSQKQQRVTDLRKQWTTEHYAEANRKILKHRLEEMAYIFFKRGETDYARMALAAAQELKEIHDLLYTNPVLEFLVDRSLALLTEARQEEERSAALENASSSSIIIP